MKKYLVEFIGTFFLMLSIVLSGDLLAVGAILTAMIYAGGHISKAHYNPAVTLGFWINRKIAIPDIAPYVLVQLAAAVIAPFVANLLGKPFEIVPKIIETGPALLAEGLGTFALVFVILNVAIAKTTAGNSFYGIAISATVVGCAVLFGDISGAAFNPAVAIGACIMGIFAWANLWIYLLASFGGAALAALVFKFLNAAESS